MSRAAKARRIAAAAAYGGGSATLLGASLYGLLVVEAKLARRAIGEPREEAPHADGRYGTADGEPLSFAVLGDSTAAGMGVDEPAETPGALIAAGLAELAGRPVQLINVAEVGAKSSGLPAQVSRALAAHPDVALIMIGANDVTGRVRPSQSVRHLGQAVRALREAGCEVVVGTCPDLGTIEPIPHPLKVIARRWSRQLAAAQTIGVVERGGRTVSLGTLLGPEFATRPRDMFSADRFHPSAYGYASAAAAMLPSVAAALGLVQADEVAPTGVLPVARAAAEAAERSGTEVSGVDLGSAAGQRGGRPRWAVLLRPRRRALPDVELAAADEPADAPAPPR